MKVLYKFNLKFILKKHRIIMLKMKLKLHLLNLKFKNELLIFIKFINNIK